MEQAETTSSGIFDEFHAVLVPVTDMARSRKFYEETLGLKPCKVHPKGKSPTIYPLGGTAHLCLYDPSDVMEPGRSSDGGAFPNFRSVDLERTHSELISKGVDCHSILQSPTLRWFSFHDPDGNRIDVCEYDESWLPG